MVELWHWLYTDELGTRRIYPRKLTAEDAKQLKDATRIEGPLDATNPVGSTSHFRGSEGAAVENSADPLLTGITRAILIVSRLRKMSKDSAPGTRTLLAELANELAGARMHSTKLGLRLAELEEKVGR